jgi:hypothetical protein
MKAAFLGALAAIGVDNYETVDTIQKVYDFCDARRAGKEPSSAVTLFAFPDYFPAVATTDLVGRVALTLTLTLTLALTLTLTLTLTLALALALTLTLTLPLPLPLSRWAAWPMCCAPSRRSSPSTQYPSSTSAVWATTRRGLG